MQRQRGDLVPIGEVIGGLDGPVQALRETPPPARRGFTLADQVNQLVGASEADPDLGFMARTMALCSLPRSNPGNQLRYVRCNGPYTLVMNAGGLNKLPYGNLPRLLMAWVSTEAVRTGSREIVLGKSLSEFMRSLGVYSSAGGVATRLRNQMRRLFHCTVSLIYEDERGAASASSLVADRTEFWWNERKPDEPMLWDSKIYLGEAFFNEIIRHPGPEPEFASWAAICDGMKWPPAGSSLLTSRFGASSRHFSLLQKRILSMKRHRDEHDLGERWSWTHDEFDLLRNRTDSGPITT